MAFHVGEQGGGSLGERFSKSWQSVLYVALGVHPCTAQAEYSDRVLWSECLQMKTKRQAQISAFQESEAPLELGPESSVSGGVVRGRSSRRRSRWGGAATNSSLRGSSSFRIETSEMGIAVTKRSCSLADIAGNLMILQSVKRISRDRMKPVNRNRPLGPTKLIAAEPNTGPKILPSPWLRSNPPLAATIWCWCSRSFTRATAIG